MTKSQLSGKKRKAEYEEVVATDVEEEVDLQVGEQHRKVTGLENSVKKDNLDMDLDATAASSTSSSSSSSNDSDSDSDNDDDENDTRPVFKFRNYEPRNEEAIRFEMIKPAVGNLDLLIDQELMHPAEAADNKFTSFVAGGEDEKSGAELLEDPKFDTLLELAPKKANWDLKRDVSKQMDLLEKRTKRAIVELLRMKIQQEESSDDSDSDDSDSDDSDSDSEEEKDNSALARAVMERELGDDDSDSDDDE